VKVEENYVEHLERCLSHKMDDEELRNTTEWWAIIMENHLRSQEPNDWKVPFRFKKTSDPKMQYLMWHFKKRGMLWYIPKHSEFRKWAEENLP
jgi:hypothetical protein